MDDEIEQLVVKVRADTAGFMRDVGTLRGGLEQGLGGGAERAGRTIESALVRAVRTGKLGFDDLRRTALGVLGEITAAAVSQGVGAALGGGAAGGLAGRLAGALFGLPGRATGGPVAPGRGYLVGERGPELFVPTASGRIETGAGGGGRDVRVSISIAAPGGSEPQALARSGRQVARAVRAALEAAEG